ncbi:DEAD/DEAH box helicase, partial [Streptococcus uberis]|nr:DEAD/DEAH box helicase [Streptococcus uberis]
MHFHITQASADKMSNDGLDFVVEEDGKTQEYVATPHITVRYDLLGEIAERTNLTRHLIASILSKIHVYKFDYFKENPEDFILKVSRIIDEEKASQIIKHIEYHVLDEVYDQQVFFDNTE